MTNILNIYRLLDLFSTIILLLVIVITIVSYSGLLD